MGAAGAVCGAVGDASHRGSPAALRPRRRGGRLRSAWPPVTSTAAGPSRRIALGERGRGRLAAAPASARASGRFGVRTRRERENHARPARPSPPGRAARAALGDHHRVDDDRRVADAAPAPRRPRSIVAAVPSIPTLTASTPMSTGTASTWATMTSGGDGWIASTPTVFWAVIAVIAVVPWTPHARKCLQIGLDAGAAAGVGAGDREHHRCSPAAHPPIVEMPRGDMAPTASEVRDQPARRVGAHVAVALETAERLEGCREGQPGGERHRVGRRCARLDRVEDAPIGRRLRQGRAAVTATAPGPSRRSSTSRASRTTAAPSPSSLFVPPERHEVTGPGHGADVRPASIAISAVISEPERSAASTTTVSARHRRHQPIARGEHPAERRRSRRQLGDDDAVAADPPVELPPRARIGAFGAGPEHRNRRGRRRPARPRGPPSRSPSRGR